MRSFRTLIKDRKIEVLWLALEYMQQYNGRTIQECIDLAMQHIYGKPKRLQKLEEV